MGWYDDAMGYVKKHPAVLAGPVGIAGDQAGLFDPRTEGQYAGVDRSNFSLPGGDAMRQRDEALGAQFGQRGAPQAADSQYWQGQQQQVGGYLDATMRGQNSLSQDLLKQNTNANAAQQRSFAAGAAPGNAAMAQRLAGQNIGRLNQNAAGQAGMMGIQERNAAANSLAGLSGQARGQTMQGNQFNVGAQLQQTGLNDQAQGNAYGRQLTAAGMDQQGGMAYEGNRTQRAAGQLAQPTPGEEFLGMAMGAAGMGGMGGKKMATGGIVTRPTQAIVGEAGPEAVIPLRQLPQMMDNGSMTGAALMDLHQRLAALEGGSSAVGGRGLSFGRLGHDVNPAAPKPSETSIYARPEELQHQRKEIPPDPQRGGGTRTKQTARR